MKEPEFTASVRDQVLYLERKSLTILPILLFQAVFFGFWYYVILKELTGTELGFYEELMQNMESMLFLLAPLFFLYQVPKHIRNLITGDIYSIDKYRGIVAHKGSEIAKAHEIQNIRIRHIDDSDEDIYSLGLMKLDGSKIAIDKSPDKMYVYDLASSIADYGNWNIEPA